MLSLSRTGIPWSGPRDPVEARSRSRASAISSASGFTSSTRSEEHTSELQSPYDLVCRLLLEKKKKKAGHENYLVYAVNPADAPPAVQDVPASRHLTDLIVVRSDIVELPRDDTAMLSVAINHR